MSRLTFSSRAQLGWGCAKRTVSSRAMAMFGGKSDILRVFFGCTLKMLGRAKIIHGAGPRLLDLKMSTFSIPLRKP